MIDFRYYYIMIINLIYEFTNYVKKLYNNDNKIKYKLNTSNKLGGDDINNLQEHYIKFYESKKYKNNKLSTVKSFDNKWIDNYVRLGWD